MVSQQNAQASWFQGPWQQLYSAAEATSWSWMDAPGAMLSGSLRFLNPVKESKTVPRPAKVSAGNRFEALKDTHEDDDVEEQS